MMAISGTARELHALVTASHTAIGGSEDLKGIAAALMTDMGTQPVVRHATMQDHTSQTGTGTNVFIPIIHAPSTNPAAPRNGLHCSTERVFVTSLGAPFSRWTTSETSNLYHPLSVYPLCTNHSIITVCAIHPLSLCRLLPSIASANSFSRQAPFTAMSRWRYFIAGGHCVNIISIVYLGPSAGN